MEKINNPAKERKIRIKIGEIDETQIYSIGRVNKIMKVIKEIEKIKKID